MASPQDELLIEHATAYVYTAFDIGQGIALDVAEQRITAHREYLKRQRRAPRYFDYQPAPLRTIQTATPQPLGRFVTANQVGLVLYDFGAVSVVHSVAIEKASFTDLIELSMTLTDDTVLLDDGRARMRLLAEAIAPAIRSHRLTEVHERYVVFHLMSSTPAWMAQPPAEHGAMLAGLLRADRAALSAEEIADALMYRISYAPDDIALIDWDAALVWGMGMDDVLAVLEFANVELLEMRFLDGQLDTALDKAYDVLARRRQRHFRPGAGRNELQQVGQLQVDSAMLFEGVNNALKLIGDQYLARVYRLASLRFHLPEWDTSILRKLQTLESIYEKMSDFATSYRMELLEWIIILLIAFEIVLSLLVGRGGH